jgi:hypothetical protein
MQDMKGRRTLVVALGIIILLLALPSSAEETGSGQVEAGIPTIDGLRAAIHGETIILTWIDDGSEAKAYAVYRSETSFSDASLADIASIAVVAPGKQNYVDRPPQGPSYYYAVAAISSEGQVLFVFRANHNATVVAISAEAPQAAALSQPSPSSPGKAAVSSQPAPVPLSAAPLLAQAPAAPSVPPAEKKLPEATLPQEAPAEAALVEKPLVEIPRPVENPAPTPVPPALESTKGPEPRSTPLPAFLYRDSSVLPGHDDENSPDQLPPETAKALHQLQDGTETATYEGPELRFLPRTQREGDAATILLAAESLLSAGDWTGARAILEPLSGSGNAGPERDCAHFYLGIALAQEGRYRDALFELLSVREAYPAQTKPWIDFVVEGLARH